MKKTDRRDPRYLMMHYKACMILEGLIMGIIGALIPFTQSLVFKEPEILFILVLGFFFGLHYYFYRKAKRDLKNERL